MQKFCFRVKVLRRIEVSHGEVRLAAVEGFRFMRGFIMVTGVSVGWVALQQIDCSHDVRGFAK